MTLFFVFTAKKKEYRFSCLYWILFFQTFQLQIFSQQLGKKKFFLALGMGLYFIFQNFPIANF